MAPEILLKHSYGPLADLWSIGVILYECLFGKAPYSSKTLDELLKKIKAKQMIEIPKLPKISKECRDILTRLLVHEPGKRMTFDAFFEHPFLSMKEVKDDANDEVRSRNPCRIEPSQILFWFPQSLAKAIEIVTKAVEQDEKQNYKGAYYLYCEALQHFVPIISREEDPAKRLQLQNRATTYLERAEEIKRCWLQWRKLQTQNSQTESSPCDTASNADCVKAALTPSVAFETLRKWARNELPAPNWHFKFFKLDSMCASTKPVQEALQIGRQGELYAYEQNFQSALESYTSALNILVPLLRNEPVGKRKELLHQQILEWMKEGESMKAIISAQDLRTDKTGSNHQCCIQWSFTWQPPPIFSIFARFFHSFIFHFFDAWCCLLCFFYILLVNVLL